MPGAHVLVVDDEPAITDLLSTALRYMGYQVTTAATGSAALEAAATANPDLVVLDVMLPDLDGFEVCRRLREQRDFVPVIFLSARDTEDDRVTGFVRGGDDYVTKPFSLEELTLRIGALLRRVRGGDDGAARLRYRDLEMDEDRHQVWRAGREIELSPTEFRLLRYFLLNPERVLSKQQILDHVWQYDFNGEDNVVETYVSYLRRKLDDGEPRLVRTVRGFGYVAPRRDTATSPMSLRTRLVVSLVATLAVALVIAGVALVGLTRQSLLDRIDQELVTPRVDGRPHRPAPGPDRRRRGRAPARRHAAGPAGNIQRAFPSGFANDPDPLPVLPVYPIGIPAAAYGTLQTRPGPGRVPRTTGSLIGQGRGERRRRGRGAADGIEEVTRRSPARCCSSAGSRCSRWQRSRSIIIRRSLLPLERIAADRQEIAAGDLSHRAGVPHDHTEVGRLGTAFDAMLDQIEESFRDQERRSRRRTRSEERLRRFVADASHELRTPLTAVRGYSDLYSAGGLTDPAELGPGDGADRDGEPADGRLVDDLLLLARLDEGRPLRADPVDLTGSSTTRSPTCGPLEPGARRSSAASSRR